MKRRQPSPSQKQSPAETARRRARLRIGPVKPSHPITPKPLRKPKYKPDDKAQED